MNTDKRRQSGWIVVSVAKDAAREVGTPDWHYYFAMRNILAHEYQACADRLRRSEGDLRH
jgi:hypothetical protein